MLYTTTRSDRDTYTPERALKEACAPDGGFYVPMQLPRYSPEELSALLSRKPAGIIAQVLNPLFSGRLTQEDLEFSLGKRWLSLCSMSHRITLAELWRNPDGDFTRVQRLLTERSAIDKRQTPVGEWMDIASRVAMLFVIFSRMERENGEKTDIALLSGNFREPMAAWYAREMGLPIGSIVCCSNENGGVWDLMKKGELKTAAPVRRTSTPKCDIAAPEGLERLIQGTLGTEEARRFAEIRGSGGVYTLRTEAHRLLRRGFHVSVVSDRRLSRVIANVYATNGYILCPYTALAYAGLMDYRAATGKSGPALILSGSSPIQCEDAVAKALGISVPELHERLDIVI